MYPPLFESVARERARDARRRAARMRLVAEAREVAARERRKQATARGAGEGRPTMRRTVWHHEILPVEQARAAALLERAEVGRVERLRRRKVEVEITLEPAASWATDATVRLSAPRGIAGLAWTTRRLRRQASCVGTCLRSRATARPFEGTREAPASKAATAPARAS